MKFPPSRFYSGRVARLRPTRRRFLQFSAAAISSLALGNCQRSASDTESTESPTTGASASPTASGTLNIYTWADYSDEEVYKRFTDKTGIEVVADVYDSNETMLAKMQAGGGAQYSIIYPSDYMVKQMIELKLLSEIDSARLQGMDDLLDKWTSPPYDPNNAHSVPVSWGTTGFIYNSEVLDPAPEDWDYLWEQKDQLSGKMTLLDDVREVLGGTLKSLGYSYNSTDPQELEEAYQKLQELKRFLPSNLLVGKTHWWREI
jgi:spermidine/putrescine transport system substrate-binding protein